MGDYNNFQNVHRQPAHKLTNDDATDESLLWRLRDPAWTTSLTGKQEKYLITHLRAWSIAMEHAKKITKLDAKLSEIYEQNEWHLFPGNVIYDFWSQKFYKVV